MSRLKQLLVGILVVIALAVLAATGGHHFGAASVQADWDRDKLARASTKSRLCWLPSLRTKRRARKTWRPCAPPRPTTKGNSMKAKTVLLLSALLLIASGCASPFQSPSVIALPQPAKPQAPAELMQPETPRMSSYQNRLNAVFETLPKPPIEKPTGSAPR
jgi:hypothetical protein